MLHGFGGLRDGAGGRDNIAFAGAGAGGGRREAVRESLVGVW